MALWWRSWGFWLGALCTAVYVVFLLFGIPYLIYQSVHDGFTKEEQLVLIGGLFVLVSLPMSVWLIYQHLIHFNRPNLQKPIIRILWMVPIYALNAWLALLFPSSTIYLDSIRECYEAYVIYNFMVYIMEALCMEMDLLAVMNEKPQIKHFFPFCCLRNWPMGNEFVYKCKHGILQYAFFQPIITVISLICELCGVYGKGTIAFGVAYPYLVLITNVSQTVAMYCLVLFYRANHRDMNGMRPLPKFLCIKAVIFFSFFQGMIINILVYFKVIKNIFGTNEQDDYQVLSEKLQNFLICLEMVLAALGHHYSYPYQEHQINIPNHRANNNFRQLVGPIFDVKDIMQDVREHVGAVKNFLGKPFRGREDHFQESKLLLSSSGGHRHQRRLEQEPVAGPSRYGTVHYMDTIPIAPSTGPYHQGGPPAAAPPFGNMFRGEERGAGISGGGVGGSSSRLVDSAPTTGSSQTVKRSESGNTNASSWPSNSISGADDDDVVNIEVRGLEQNLIQLPNTPPL